MSEEPYGYIYLIKNLYNNKVYIGQSKHIDQINNYYGSGILIKRIIKKYGISYLKKIIIGFCNSKKELNEAEIICIDFYQSNDKRYGYNLTKGGEGTNGTKLSDITKQKMSKSRTGNKNPMYGKHRSEETKEKLRKANLGKHHSKETKLKLSKIFKGKKSNREYTSLSNETKQKISKALKMKNALKRGK